MSYKRKLMLMDYRNLGIGDDGPATLILNQNAKKDSLGSLIVLVGPNNSGKSNILEALNGMFSSNAIPAECVPDFVFDRETATKALFTVTDGIDSWTRTKTPNGSSWQHLTKQPNEIEVNSQDMLAYLTSAQFIASSYIGGGDLLRDITSALEKAKRSELTEKEFSVIISKYSQTIEKIAFNYGGNVIAQYQKGVTPSVGGKYGLNKKDEKAFENAFEQKFGYHFVPNVHLYKEVELHNSDLSVNPTNPLVNPLFKSLFNSIGLSVGEIKKIYEGYSNNHNISLLTQLEKKTEPKVQSIADRFNNLYFAHDPHFQYRFELKFENNLISFGMTQGNRAINLEKQSTGFRYFFDLFFNYFNVNECVPGDILIMDEPGTCLHVKGQEELRGFLKDFAMKNGLTIVLSTHSPFLVDPNNLDEVRMVVPTDNGAKIDNDFYYSGDDDPDTISPIAKALTTRNSVVLDPDKKLILVEGITDYNYLTGFAAKLGINSLVFLPVNGLGKKGEQKGRISEMLRIRRDATLLADGDMAGQKSRESSKDTGLTVICLSEIDASWKEIEDLFDQKDKEVFSLPRKSSGESETLKLSVLNGGYKFSEKTISSFKKVLSCLEDN